MQGMYLILVQNKSSLCTNILCYSDNSITRHLMFLFFWIGAVQNRIYQHVCVCKGQASTSTINLSVNGSMCLPHSAMPLHSTVNNREEPDPRKGSCLQTAKLEIYDTLTYWIPEYMTRKVPYIVQWVTRCLLYWA